MVQSKTWLNNQSRSLFRRCPCDSCRKLITSINNCSLKLNREFRMATKQRRQLTLQRTKTHLVVLVATLIIGLVALASNHTSYRTHRTCTNSQFLLFRRVSNRCLRQCMILVGLSVSWGTKITIMGSLRGKQRLISANSNRIIMVCTREELQPLTLASNHTQRSFHEHLEFKNRHWVSSKRPRSLPNPWAHITNSKRVVSTVRLKRHYPNRQARWNNRFRMERRVGRPSRVLRRVWCSRREREKVVPQPRQTLHHITSLRITEVFHHLQFSRITSLRRQWSNSSPPSSIGHWTRLKMMFWRRSNRLGKSLYKSLWHLIPAHHPKCHSKESAVLNLVNHTRATECAKVLRNHAVRI